MSSDIGSVQKNAYSQDGTGSTTSGSGAGRTNTQVGGGTTLPPKIEIRHLIEPNLSFDPNYSSGTGYAGGGSYVRKLTLPQNFQGRLYLAGINIATLSSTHVRVRFKFGVNREPITIPATIIQAPGITPQTDISVLVMDLRSEPFKNLRLPYDLFDYNDYNFDNGDAPTQDNRDTGLYCRGLRIEDDPTFTGVGACDGLQSQPGQPAEECLYAYAKVQDQGLIQETGSVKIPITPSLAQVKSNVGGFYYQDFLSELLKKPLLDTMPTSNPYTAGAYKFSEQSVGSVTDAVNITFGNNGSSVWDPMNFLGRTYYYRGPYRLINTSEWQFRFAELDGDKKLFRKDSWVNYPLYLSQPLVDDNQVNPTQNRIYFNSYLFPLATKLDLNASVPHLASGAVLAPRVEQNLPSSGKTLWMDGANARAQSLNNQLQHMGSCNVTSTIEIIAKDKNNQDYIVALSKDVKLQLVRSSQHRTDLNNDVLYSNFKRCSSNSACSSTECCFNQRCWDQSLVSQCLDSSVNTGNRPIGESCANDLECSSFCCNRTTGKCAQHNTNSSPPVLCGKPAGDFCISKEWCQKSTVVKCVIVSTTDRLGNPSCRQACTNVQEFGDCKKGICVAPVQEAIPSFDPTAEGACDGAIPSPNF